jgi:hypothetical protein
LLHLLLHQIHRELLYIFNIIFIAARTLSTEGYSLSKRKEGSNKNEMFYFYLQMKTRLEVKHSVRKW